MGEGEHVRGSIGRLLDVGVWNEGEPDFLLGARTNVEHATCC